MAGITIRAEVDANKQFERLRRGTGVTFTKFSRSIGRKVGNKHKRILLSKLEKYPRKRPGQRYKRTFKLRRGWKTTIRAPRTGFTMKTDNPVPYTHFVVGKPDLRLKAGGRGQAWMHVGRWWIAGGVIKRQYAKMELEYIDEMYDTLDEQAGVKTKRRSSLLR